MRGPKLLVGSGAVCLIVACSLTDLDGFTGGGPTAGPDGGGGGPDDAKVVTTAPDDRDGTVATETEAGGLPTDAYGDAVRTDEPAAWWRFEDAEGTRTLEDATGRHHAQVLPRNDKPITIQWGIPGVSGHAAKLTIAGGFFEIGDVFDFAGLSELALEAWVQNESPAAEYETVFAKRVEISGDPQTGWIVFLHKPASSFGFQFWKAQNVNASTSLGPLPPGFHHLVLNATRRADGVEYAMFLDGELRDSDGKNVVEQDDTTAPLRLGFNWNGALDEMAIYEHALAAERILAHYKVVHP